MFDAAVRDGRKPGTWILVADDRRARILESAVASGEGWQESDVFEHEPVALPQGHVFMQALVRYLTQAHACGRFSRLIVIARGVVLKMLYGAFPPDLRAAVGLLTEADLIDAGADVIRSCLPGVHGAFHQTA